MRRLLFFTLALISTAAHGYTTAAWIPSWDAAAIDSVQRNAGRLDESNPVWYALDRSGRVVPMWNAEKQTLRAAMSGTRLMPTIQNAVDGRFDSELVRSLIGTSEARERHAEEITRLVVEKAYDGIDIDYEALPSTDRASYSAFIRLLAEKLHSEGRLLSVTVHPKTSDSQNWSGPGSQDYSAIGAAADSVKLMVYDYHWSTSGPGSIAPLDWAAAVVGYAVSTIPAEKVIVGLPWFGYDWQGSIGKGIVHSEAIALAGSVNATVTRDESGEAVFHYADHVVHFQDAAAYQRKVRHILELHPNVGGFTTWRVGGEDPLIWDEVARIKEGNAASTTEPTPAPAPVPEPDLRVIGPQGVVLEQGSHSELTYETESVNGFASPIDVRVLGMGDISVDLSLSSSRIQPGDAMELRITARKDALAGTHRATIRFTGGGITRDLLLDVIIEKAATRSRGARRR